MRLYSTKEFAELAGVSIRTLKRWRRDGKIQPVKTGKNNSVFYSDKQLAKFRVITLLNKSFEVSSGDKLSDNLTSGDKKISSGDTAACVEEKKVVIILNNEEKSIQLQPVNKFLVPIDKLSKDVFRATEKSTERAIVEIKNKRLEIITQYDLECLKGDLNQFDRLIFCAAISEYSAGNKVFTVRRLWQKIGGGYNLPDEIEKIISDSVNKLACTRIKINMTQINNKCHYSDKRELIFENYLLPCKVMTLKINGKLVDKVFKITDEPPLLEVATLKKQFTFCNASLLNVPRLKNTVPTLKIKSFLLEQVIQIIGSHKPRGKRFCGRDKNGKPIHKNITEPLPKIILLEKVFAQCDLSDASKWQLQDARATISKVMDHFKEHIITEWHFEKKNGKFYSIHFDFI